MTSVGLIGFGYSAKTFHAPLITSTTGLNLDAIVQRSGDEAAHAYPSAEIFRSVDDMLKMTRVELIVVATSNPSHFPLAKQCLMAERNVVIDKPFALDTKEARELVELGRCKDKLLSVFHNRRWDGDFLTLQQLQRERKCGRVIRVDSNFDRYRPTVDATAWRQREESGSGVFFDLAPHMLDQSLISFGEPISVEASIRREREGALVDDAFDLVLNYAEGPRVTLGASMLACVPRARFGVWGETGAWIKLGLDPQEAALKRGERPAAAGWAQEPDTAHGTLMRCDAAKQFTETIVTLPGNYLAYYENIRDAIAGTAELIVTPGQALRVMELMEACRQSAMQQRIVSLNHGGSGRDSRAT